MFTGIFAELAPLWRAKGYGVFMGDTLLLPFVVWAEEAWLVSKHSEEFNEMAQDLEREVPR